MMGGVGEGDGMVRCIRGGDKRRGVEEDRRW